MPRDLAMILSIMVRFLFLFVDELAAIRKSQKSRNFNIHAKNIDYKWRVKQVGYTIGMMFLKAYEQGERVHKSMISRGFSDTSEMFNEKKKAEKTDYFYLIVIMILTIIIEIILFKYSGKLGYFGENIAINQRFKITDIHLATKNLSFIYPDGTKALKNVNIEIKRGKKIAIIGPNGAGKSTLFSHFNGLSEPTSGHVEIDGEKVEYKKEKLLQVRQKVGIVFQDPNDQLFAPTVKEDIAQIGRAHV